MTREEAIKVISLTWRAQTLPLRIAAPSLDELERITAGAAVDALLASGFRYVGPDEVVVKRDKWVPSAALANSTDASWQYHGPTSASEKEKK